MSIIVHRDESIEEALKRLHGEAIRENIFEVLNEKRYFIKDSEKRCAIRREKRKRKRKGRRAKRRKKNKGS